MYSSEVGILNAACRAYPRALAATRAKLIINPGDVIFNLNSTRWAYFLAPATRYTAIFTFFTGNSTLVMIAAGDNNAA